MDSNQKGIVHYYILSQLEKQGRVRGNQLIAFSQTAFLEQVKTMSGECEERILMGEEGEISSVDCWSLVLSSAIICRLSAKGVML